MSAVVVAVALSPATPGPVAHPWLRIAVGALAAVAVLGVPEAVSRVGPGGPDQVGARWKVAFGLGMVLLFAVVVAVVVGLLGVVVGPITS